MKFRRADGNFVAEQTRMMREAKLGPGYFHSVVLHDDWCDLVAVPERGSCNCNPDILSITKEPPENCTCPLCMTGNFSEAWRIAVEKRKTVLVSENISRSKGNASN